MNEKVFTEKELEPNRSMVKTALSNVYSIFELLEEHLLKTHGTTKPEWKYYGKKNGWTLKTLLKKRNLFFIGIYDGFFKITFIFGAKAEKAVLESNVSKELKEAFMSNKKYMEGRPLSIDVKDNQYLEDIKKLIEIKVSN